MKLVVISHKECWEDPHSPSGYATVGGFPYQMRAISELFDQTHILVPIFELPKPAGVHPLVGHNLSIVPLDPPTGSGFRRKLSIVFWLFRNLPRIWRYVRASDAVHIPIPGDIGTIGILVTLIQKKPLFVRHCGTWGNKDTLVSRFVSWLLPKIAGGSTVVMATGGGDRPPCPSNLAIEWIFSTTLSEQEIKFLPIASAWSKGEPLRLVTVSRITAEKNIQSTLHALVLVRQQYPQLRFDIVGGGDYLDTLKDLAVRLGLEDVVHFHGYVAHDRVIQILSQSHLFVFPTRVREGFPKAVHEALACGLPVITSPVSVLPHLIGTQNGVVLADTRPETIASELLSLISDETRVQAMSRSARETSLQYTLDAWKTLIAQRLEVQWGTLSLTP